MINCNKQRITITIDSQMYIELEDMCEKKNTTKSEIINAILYSCFWHNDTLMKKIVLRNNHLELKKQAIDKGLNKIEEIQVVFGVTKNDKSKK